MQRGAGGHREPGKRVDQRADGLLLVHRVAERPEERHRERFDLLAFDERGRGGHDLFGIERCEHDTVAIEALVDPDDAAALDDLRRHHQPAVLVHAPAARERHEIFETFGGHQPDSASLAKPMGQLLEVLEQSLDRVHTHLLA